MAIFALSVPVGSTNLAAIVDRRLDDPARVLSPASLLAAVALVVVISPRPAGCRWTTRPPTWS